MTARPIIIIGAARSGTNFLRDLLAASARTRAVPYDVNSIWRYKAGPVPDDALPVEDLSFEKRDFIRQTLRDQAGIPRGDTDTVLIEKTVSNTLRVPFVHRVFPEAHFIHLVRDGRDVTRSAMSMWQAKPDLGALWTKVKGAPLSNLGYVLGFGANFIKGLLSGHDGGKTWGPRYPGFDADLAERPLVEICARQWLHALSAARRDLAELPPEQVHEIRYEALVASRAPLEWLLQRVGLDGDQQVLGAYDEHVDRSASGHWREAMTPEHQARMLDCLTPALEQLGYLEKEAEA